MTPIRRSSLAALCAAWLASSAVAQVPSQQSPAPPPRPAFDPTGVGDTSIFAPLNLQPGTVFRSGSGMPGPKYWQQRASYDIRGTLDTATKSLRGEMTLRYTNNSVDTLRFVWFQVEQNAFRANSLNSFVFPPDSRFGARNFEGGTAFDRVNVVTPTGKKPIKTRVDGTQMKADLPAP